MTMPRASTSPPGDGDTVSTAELLDLIQADVLGGGRSGGGVGGARSSGGELLLGWRRCQRPVELAVPSNSYSSCPRLFSSLIASNSLLQVHEM